MKEGTREFEVAAGEARERLDRFLVQKVPELSRSRLQALIKAGAINRNGQTARASERLKTGDRIQVEERPSTSLELEAEALPLDVLYEDRDLLVLNKAAGMSVHPGAGRSGGTLVNALLAHCHDLSGIGGKERPGIVHRLDRETSGCLVVAKNDLAHVGLSRQFATRTVQKLYLALAAGRVHRSAGKIEAALRRHPVHRKKMAVNDRGRPAVTDYRVIRSSAIASLLECRLHTGRTHQIRVHLHYLGHPLLGDKLYGGRRAGDYPRQMLHAWQLAFIHPRTQEQKKFTAPLPPDFTEAMARALGEFAPPHWLAAQTEPAE